MEYADKVIYQVFVRNHTEEGTLKALVGDLDRIKGLGADILYLMPVQPIGVKGRKGSLGSPYAISDYSKINPELGDWDDFRLLVAKAHEKGLKVIVDQVFNHTSRDSVLLSARPEFYYRGPNGELGNKIGDWSDVYDLDYGAPGLIDYLLGILDLFLDAGADGFRFDVASLIPASFFASLKNHLETRYPNRDVILLAESIEGSFALEARSAGYNATCNAVLSLNGFSLFYSYFSFPWLRDYLAYGRKEDLACYRAACILEEAAIPSSLSYITRALENHDQRRLASYSLGDARHHGLLAFSFFTKGPAFVYAGEEYGVAHQPSLFDSDKVDWAPLGKQETLEYVSKLISLKRRKENEKLRESVFPDSKGELFVVRNRFEGYSEWGVFNFSGNPLPLPEGVLPKGNYVDLLGGAHFANLDKGGIEISEPLWLKAE